MLDLPGGIGVAVRVSVAAAQLLVAVGGDAAAAAAAAGGGPRAAAAAGLCAAGCWAEAAAVAAAAWRAGLSQGWELGAQVGSLNNPNPTQLQQDRNLEECNHQVDKCPTDLSGRC